MSTIQIADGAGATADLQIRDDCPLAKAKPTQLLSAAASFIQSLSAPVDKCQISHLTLGGAFTSPALLPDGSPGLTITGGVNCGLSISTSANKLLFADDGFSPSVPIENNQAWIGFDVDAALGTQLSGSFEGFGVGVQGNAAVILTTFTLFEGSTGPLPTLKDAFVSALEHFSVTLSVSEIRTQEAGTVNVSELSGSISLTGSYSLPVSVNALASANLPFNLKLSVSPMATMEVAGTLSLSGDYLVRSQKLPNEVLHFGVYKRKGSTLSASITARVGVGLEAGTTDLLGTLLNAVLPGVDVSKSGLSGDSAKTLHDVIKQSLDRSLSIGLNASCSAATTDEAAALYEIALNQGDSAITDAALKAALKGDWTAIDSLPNARRLRNVMVETKERKEKIAINLLGLYNAVSAEDYLSKCTILHDDTGQVTIVDKVEASRVLAASTPYAADPDKLRVALAQDFITTASYAVLGSKLNLTLTLVQDYLDYADKMSRQDLRDNILLGTALGLIPVGTFDVALAANNVFSHAAIRATIRYDGPAVMSIFFADPTSRTVRTRLELESLGRQAMLSLLDPNESGNPARIAALSSDAAWEAMDYLGNVSAFGGIPELANLNPPELGAVGADWVSIAWWADSISEVAPSLSQTLTALESSTAADPSTDSEFMAKRATLASILGSVARNTKAAFENGWGPAVIFALSGRHGAAEMDISWASNIKHFE